MKRYLWKTKSGVKVPMSEMDPQALQQAFELAEKTHVESENAIQRALVRSSIFLEKIQQFREVAQARGLLLQSLSEKHPGKYKILDHTYNLIEA